MATRLDLSLLASVEMVDSAADSCLQCRVHPSTWLDHACPLDSIVLGWNMCPWTLLSFKWVCKQKSVLLYMMGREKGADNDVVEAHATALN